MPIKQLTDGTCYIKATYLPDDKVLKGNWEVFRKLDGVRALRMNDGSVVSRNSKPLYNLDQLEFNDAEIFRTDWETSVSLVRTQHHQQINQDDVYNLDPPDRRLSIGSMFEPSWERLQEWMERALQRGEEGLIIRKGKTWYKVVPKKFADIRITGYKEGTGKNAGMLGSFQTNYGSVGTGFTDTQRIKFWQQREKAIGKIIQVSYREQTKTGKLRFPAFERLRLDKDEESV